MKKILLLFVFAISGKFLMAQSIDPVSLIVAKVIKAIDLKVQRLQNQTLVLQYAQAAAEQELAKNKLSEITGWQQQLSKLYDGYFAELKTVKSTLTGGTMVKKIFSLHQQVMTEYGRVGKNEAVKVSYDVLLDHSMEVLRTLQMVLGSELSMKDADRICVLRTLQDAMSHCVESLQSLNKGQIEMASNRTRLQADLDYVKRLYGLK